MEQLFKDFLNEEIEYQISFLEGDYANIYTFGLFTEKFLTKDARLVEQFPIVRDNLNDENFRARAVALTREKLGQEKLSLIARLKQASCNGYSDPISLAILERVEKNLNALSFDQMLSDYKMIFDGFREISTVKSDIGFYEDNYPLFCVLKLFYEDFISKANDRFSIKEDNRLIAIYKENNIDLNKQDQQFNKYKLLTIDDNFEIRNSNIPKVFDKRLNTHILVNEISPEMLSLLKDLKQKGFISQLSLRPEYNLVGRSLKDPSYAMEEVERGKIFNFQNLSEPLLSKLFTIEDYSSLWINIDGQNITFEELIDDFHVEDSSIVTQVVHLEYIEESGNHIITHIDHEYIFYSVEEYEARQKNHRQKGTTKTRFKTFKVDNSKIPFTLENGDFFLYRVLDEYFQKKELLEEYFNEVLVKPSTP